MIRRRKSSNCRIIFTERSLSSSGNAPMTTRVEKGPKVKPPTYLWRKFVQPRWIDFYEEKLSTRVGDEFAVITRPDRTRALFEATCKSQKQARDLVKEFGGRIEKLSRDWLKRFTRAQKTASLKIGRRLIIFHVGGTSVSRVRAGRTQSRRQG